MLKAINVYRESRAEAKGGFGDRESLDAMAAFDAESSVLAANVDVCPQFPRTASYTALAPLGEYIKPAACCVAHAV